MKLPMIRRKLDTNSVWGDIARNETLDTRRGFARAVSRLVYGLTGLVAAASLVAAGLGLGLLFGQQPNTKDVSEQTIPSIFEVVCKGSSGSGVAIDVPMPATYKTAVFTAEHVVSECEDNSTIQLINNGVRMEGVLAARDAASITSIGEGTDIALIYLTNEVPSLEAAPAGEVGDWVIIIGHPWDETNYVTLGVISASTQNEYKTDASANEGNSGGPLLDANGRVLGLISYKPCQEDRSPGYCTAADGITVAKKLSLTCKVIYARAANCPFEVAETRNN
jgi:S1-C subfamily serine protease